MSLRLKAWLVFLAAMAVVVGAVLWLLNATLLASFARFEEIQVRRDAERLVHSVQAEASHLETVVADWAEWDDSYEYMSTGSTAYVDSNLGADTYQTLGLSLLAYVKPSGEIVHGHLYDNETTRLLPIPAGTLAMLASEAATGHLDPGETGVRGICRQGDSTHLVAARHIVRGDGSGPSRGLLVMCRPLDHHMVAHLAEALDLEVSVQASASATTAPSMSQPSFLRDGGSRIEVLPPEPEFITARVELPDIHGMPALALHIVEPRTITETGRSVTRVVSVSLLIALILAGLAVQLVLERGVLARLSSLDADLLRVAETRDLSLRVGERGRDEVARLARGINATLSALESAEGTLRDSEERYRAIVEEQTELICRWRPDGTLVFANRAFHELLGDGAKGALGRRFPGLESREPAGVSVASGNVMPTCLSGEFVQQVAVAEGPPRWIQWHTVPLASVSGDVIEYQSVGRDTTEQRATADALREAERDACEALGGPAEIGLLTDLGGQVLATNEATAARLERAGLTSRDLRVDHLLGNAGALDWRRKAEQAAATQTPVRWDSEVRGRTFDLIARPSATGPGRVDRLATVGRDVTDQRRAEVAERRLAAAAARRAILESVARDLEAKPRSGQAVLERLDELAAAETASLCAIHILAADGDRLLPVTLKSSLPETSERLARRRPLRARPCGRGSVCDAIAVMEPLELAGETARSAFSALMPEVEPFLGHLPSFFMRLTPIVVAGRAAGLLTAVREAGEAPHSAEDREFLDEIAARAALAVGQVTLYNQLQAELRERARVEDALRDARQVFLEASRSLRGVLWIRQAKDGRITYVSPGWEHVWGRRCDSLYADEGELLAGVHPDDREMVTPELTAIHPTADCVLEFRVVRPDGEVRWVVARQVFLAGAERAQDKVFGMAEDVTERKAVEDRSRRLDAQVRQLARRLDEAREEERHALATWIHDEIGQMLTALRLDLAWIRKRIPDSGPEVLAAVEEMEGLIDRNVAAVQRVATELRPTMLEDFGLPATIEWELDRFQRRTGIGTTLKVTPDGRPLPPPTANALYQVFREALTNVARHAGASAVSVDLDAPPHEGVVFSVSDDGRGIRDTEIAGLGIVGMRERVSAVGGRLEVSSGETGGTTITVRIPPK